MWIEVIGLPGVGKTTIIEQNRYNIIADFKIIKSDDSALAQKIMARIFYNCRYKFLTNDASLAKKLAYRHSFRFFENKATNIFFYDSGLIQVILENLIETNFTNSKEKLALLNKIPLPQKVIFMTDTLEDIVAREINRTASRFQLNALETSSRYKIADKLIKDEVLHKVDFVYTIHSQDTEKFVKALQDEKTL